MNMNKLAYSKELQTAFKAAQEAGNIIDNYSEKGFETERKSDGSKVTEADRKSQEKIVEVISNEFPDDGFLGEEEHLTPGDEDRVWVIDPIDGTFNFSKSFQNYCVSIALKEDDEVIVGVVFSPESSLDKTYFAVRGESAFTTDSGIDSSEPISVSNQSEIEDSLFFMSSFDIYEGQLDSELSLLRDFAERGAIHRQIGSCALEMCRVAEGSVGFQLTPIVKEWDYAAAKLIVEAAGGEVRIRDSKFPNCTEVVCSNGILQDEVEQVVGDIFV